MRNKFSSSFIKCCYMRPTIYSFSFGFCFVQKTNRSNAIIDDENKASCLKKESHFHNVSMWRMCLKEWIAFENINTMLCVVNCCIVHLSWIYLLFWDYNLIFKRIHVTLVTSLYSILSSSICWRFN